jgi:hydroxyacylglutathione hydrolase
MESALRVERICNYPIPSNCYILYSGNNRNCIVIDPGTPDNKKLLEFLDGRQLQISIVIITHEHFDHCAGLLSLNRKEHFSILCTEKTARGLKNPRKNFSAFFEEIGSFGITEEVIIITEKDIYSFEDHSLRFYETPGHTPGGLCIQAGKYLFTGDTLIYNGSALRVPGSKKEDLEISLKRINRLITKGTIVCPGHGESKEIS